MSYGALEMEHYNIDEPKKAPCLYNCSAEEHALLNLPSIPAK